jgi:two-component system sporulation sensor kinase B
MFDIDNSSHARRYIPIIKQEIERTLTLMSDFMMFTKINIEKRKMDVSVLLQDVCEMSYFMLKDKKIKFSCSVMDEEVLIDGDYGRLKQVFTNIIKNAMEAIDDSKQGVIKFHAKASSKGFIVTIADNGAGMNKQVLSKIGEAFYTTKSGGTGLGVKFSKEIIEAQGGYINYKSSPSVGTTVSIMLPLKNPCDKDF